MDPTLPTMPVIAPVTDAEIADRAADVLEEFDWCWGDLALDANGEATQEVADGVEFCAMGAIRRALYDLGHDPWGESAAVVERMVFKELGIADGWLSQWNDERGRTKAEVVALFRAAAARARAES